MGGEWGDFSFGFFGFDHGQCDDMSCSSSASPLAVLIQAEQLDGFAFF